MRCLAPSFSPLDVFPNAASVVILAISNPGTRLPAMSAVRDVITFLKNSALCPRASSITLSVSACLSSYFEGTCSRPVVAPCGFAEKLSKGLLMSLVGGVRCFVIFFYDENKNYGQKSGKRHERDCHE